VKPFLPFTTARTSSMTLKTAQMGEDLDNSSSSIVTVPLSLRLLAKNKKQYLFLAFKLFTDIIVKMPPA
jgi:hypothetical protein